MVGWSALCHSDTRLLCEKEKKPLMCRVSDCALNSQNNDCGDRRNAAGKNASVHTPHVGWMVSCASGSSLALLGVSHVVNTMEPCLMGSLERCFLSSKLNPENKDINADNEPQSAPLQQPPLM